MKHARTRELVRRFQAGDDKAGERLYNDYHALVVSCVNRANWPTSLMERGDVEAVVARGFMKALAQYNPDRGVQLNTYAYEKMRSELRHYIRDSIDLVKIPGWVKEQAFKGNEDAQDVQERFRNLDRIDDGDFDIPANGIPSDIEVEFRRVVDQWPEHKRVAALFIVAELNPSDYCRTYGKTRQNGHRIYTETRKRLRRALDAYQEAV